jgi:glycolate oxidase FAD binding subunit
MRDIVETIEIESAAQAREALCAAGAQNLPLGVEGGGTRARLGRHAPAARILRSTRLSGITLYEPEELVLSARAGTPLREIEALLDRNNQQLAFEPMDHAALYGGEPRAGTIGGAIAVNAAGPRRIKAGAARDHLLGFEGVTGRGDIVKSGGRVMKNVTGFDLSKLVCGSFGTLLFLTELTLKVLPKAEIEQTVLLLGVDEEEGLRLLRRASATPYEVSGYALTPAGVVHGVDVNAVALRIEGPKISVSARREALIAALAGASARCAILQPTQSAAFWASLRDVEPIAPLDADVWRLSVAPTDAFGAVDAIRRAGAPLLAHYYDWAGGLIWLALASSDNACASIVRAAIDTRGGHATLVRAHEATRASVDVFHPQSAPLAALARRVKDAFDPKHILERGRMRAEF